MLFREVWESEVDRPISGGGRLVLPTSWTVLFREVVVEHGYENLFSGTVVVAMDENCWCTSFTANWNVRGRSWWLRIGMSMEGEVFEQRVVSFLQVDRSCRRFVVLVS